VRRRGKEGAGKGYMKCTRVEERRGGEMHKDVIRKMRYERGGRKVIWERFKKGGQRKREVTRSFQRGVIR
jgi:hypothetical protein